MQVYLQRQTVKLNCWVQMEAIFRHESQKDRALFPGADDREFWQRAKDRNKVTAATTFAKTNCDVQSFT